MDMRSVRSLSQFIPKQGRLVLSQHPASHPASQSLPFLPIPFLSILFPFVLFRSVCYCCFPFLPVVFWFWKVTSLPFQLDLFLVIPVQICRVFFSISLAYSSSVHIRLVHSSSFPGYFPVSTFLVALQSSPSS